MMLFTMCKIFNVYTVKRIFMTSITVFTLSTIEIYRRPTGTFLTMDSKSYVCTVYMIQYLLYLYYPTLQH